MWVIHGDSESTGALWPIAQVVWARLRSLIYVVSIVRSLIDVVSALWVDVWCVSIHIPSCVFCIGIGGVVVVSIGGVVVSYYIVIIFWLLVVFLIICIFVDFVVVFLFVFVM